jgi:hypothetical protein
MSARRFDRALEAMRSGDPGLREDGFDFLREHADAYVDELITAFTQARSAADQELLLELIAEARSPQALRVLAGRLDSEDEALRFWAIRGLEMLDTREARQELDRAEANGWLA